MLLIKQEDQALLIRNILGNCKVPERVINFFIWTEINSSKPLLYQNPSHINAKLLYN